MNTYEVGKKYVALVKEGRREECLSTLFSDDAVSVEAAEFPGHERDHLQAERAATGN
ncbi:MAG TPA: hypothetical protein VH374_19610 [Polyangia bacterium]|jgi:hypothetical protein|nr:hypothetical protein [Polyangia bacterium]